jgi:type II secretory ATPase GspE/PulE/Tfp pilus assembly ATPase PilB-like protein
MPTVQGENVVNRVHTVEDPVENRVEGINQIQVKNSTELTFSKALKQILQHDPDVIMVGKIRDAETAKIAVESSLTGHLVLPTLHTNSAASAITRMLELG